MFCTFIAIVNSRPSVPVSTDPENPCVLSKVATLTQKTAGTTEDFKKLCFRNVYPSQWKYVLNLEETFRHRWKTEYLQSLQKEENAKRCRKR